MLIGGEEATECWLHLIINNHIMLCITTYLSHGPVLYQRVPRRQSHRRSGMVNLPSVVAVPCHPTLA